MRKYYKHFNLLVRSPTVKVKRDRPAWLELMKVVPESLQKSWLGHRSSSAAAVNVLIFLHF